MMAMKFLRNLKVVVLSLVIFFFSLKCKLMIWPLPLSIPLHFKPQFSTCFESKIRECKRISPTQHNKRKICLPKGLLDCMRLMDQDSPLYVHQKKKRKKKDSPLYEKVNMLMFVYYIAPYYDSKMKAEKGN